MKLLVREGSSDPLKSPLSCRKIRWCSSYRSEDLWRLPNGRHLQVAKLRISHRSWPKRHHRRCMAGLKRRAYTKKKIWEVVHFWLVILVAEIREVYQAFLPVKLISLWQMHFKSCWKSTTNLYLEHASVLHSFNYSLWVLTVSIFFWHFPPKTSPKYKKPEASCWRHYPIPNSNQIWWGLGLFYFYHSPLPCRFILFNWISSMLSVRPTLFPA